MKTAIAFPRRYVQGEGVLSEIGRHTRALGRSPLVVWGPRTRDAVGPTVSAALDRDGLQWKELLFGGECSKAEVTRIVREAAAAGADVIVGLGGGKAVDAAKGAAAQAELPVVVVPTIASNDAPTSAVTVWYDDDGECVGFDIWQHNPDVVLLDTGVIARAPRRYFVAGIGDALATWPEASAADRSGAAAVAGGQPTRTAMAMARLCFDTVMKDGRQAIRAVERGEVTPALERVVEANVLLSGVGWESGGLACAHAIANFLPCFHETHDRLHGEKVAFGLVTQLCLERDREVTEVLRIVDFMVELGLPVTFAELGLEGVSTERIAAFGKLVAAEGSFVHNHAFPVNAHDVADALVAADDLGAERLRARGPTAHPTVEEDRGRNRPKTG